MDELLQSIKRRLAEQSRRFCPPLTEAEALEFEASHAVTLPEGYRRFIIEIGNGGEGPPSYGLVPLASWPHSPAEPEAAYWEQLPDLARPFPFTKPWIWEDGEISQEGTEDQIRHGNLLLGTEGRGLRTGT
ncbi:MAG: SMI1/KNR4 family protein [Isosphaeraceae bacterium]